MYKYKLILCCLVIGVCLGYSNISFGQSDCHEQILIKGYGTQYPINSHYTCNYTTPEEETKLSNYCARNNAINNWVSAICTQPNLGCHICKCDVGMVSDSMGRCCLIGRIDTNGICCPDGMDIIEGFCTEPVPDEEENNGGNEGEGESNNNGQNQDLNTFFQACPNEQLDSQGNCCKKRYYDVQEEREMCCEGILLNTNVPFIGQCIVYRKASEPQPESGLVVDESSAFPVLMGGLSRILVSAILLTGFIGILIGGVMISASGGTEEGAKNGRKIIGNIITAFGLLGASGVILKLINPTFFG